MFRSVGYVPPRVTDRRIQWDENTDTSTLSKDELKRFRNTMRQRKRRAEIYEDDETREL